MTSPIIVPVVAGSHQKQNTNFIGEREIIKREIIDWDEVRITYRQYNSALGRMDEYSEREFTWQANAVFGPIWILLLFGFMRLIFFLLDLMFGR